MKACIQSSSVTVIDQCPLLTPAQWLAAPGTCRLRVKNFNPADWVAGACGTCTNAGGTTWDGTFPVWTPGVSFNIDPATGNIGGKTPLPGLTFNYIRVFGGAWIMEIDCDGAPPQFIWGSDLSKLFATGPVGIYTRNVGCVLAATFEIEAYTP